MPPPMTTTAVEEGSSAISAPDLWGLSGPPGRLAADGTPAQRPLQTSWGRLVAPVSLPRTFLDQYDEPFGFMDFAAIGAMSIPARTRLSEMAEAMSGRDGKLIPLVMGEIETASRLAAELI